MDTECMCPVMEKPQLFCGRVFCLIRGFSKGIYGITGLISLFFWNHLLPGAYRLSAIQFAEIPTVDKYVMETPLSWLESNSE